MTRHFMIGSQRRVDTARCAERSFLAESRGGAESLGTRRSDWRRSLDSAATRAGWVHIRRGSSPATTSVNRNVGIVAEPPVVVRNPLKSLVYFAVTRRSAVSPGGAPGLVPRPTGRATAATRTMPRVALPRPATDVSDRWLRRHRIGFVRSGHDAARRACQPSGRVRVTLPEQRRQPGGRADAGARRSALPSLPHLSGPPRRSTMR